MLEVDILPTSYICMNILVFIFLKTFLYVTVSAMKTCSRTTFKTVIQEGFLYFFSSMPVNLLNQYRVTVGVFNNHNSAQCNSYNIGYNQSFRNCSSFTLVSVIFICLFYLFTLIVYLESSLSYMAKVKSRTICGYLHIILHICLIFLYVNHFWFFKIVLKLSGDIEENRDLNLALAKVSLFVTGI